jgi:hypothetical protein
MSFLIADDRDGGFMEETKLEESRVELENFLKCIKGNRKLGNILCDVRTMEYDNEGDPVKWNDDGEAMKLLRKMLDRIFSGEQKVNGKRRQWNNGCFGSRWYDDYNTYMTCRVAFYSKKSSTEWKHGKTHLLVFTFEPRDKSTCEECGKQDYGYKKCSSCKVTRYCSEECQQKHWKAHKPQCKKYQDLYNEDEE